MNHANLVCKQNVGAEMNTLMSISDGLGRSIFSGEMERARPMRELMDEKFVFIFVRVGIPTTIY